MRGIRVVGSWKIGGGGVREGWQGSRREWRWKGMLKVLKYWKMVNGVGRNRMIGGVLEK
jgi:hypothetical protein